MASRSANGTPNRRRPRPPVTADHTPERRCTHPKPEFRWDGKQWGWVCPLCSTALVLVEAAHLADAKARLAREGLGALLDRLLSEHWPNCGVNPWYLADLLRAALHPGPTEPVLGLETSGSWDQAPRLHPDPSEPT